MIHPPFHVLTNPLIHPITYLPNYTHSSIHLPSHMGLPTHLFPIHFPICSSIHLPPLLPLTIHPSTHPYPIQKFIYHPSFSHSFSHLFIQSIKPTSIY